MIKVAIFGASRTGKTTIAYELGSLMTIPVRHCGEIVKRFVRERGLIEGAELSREDHRQIDDETRNVAEALDSVIVEGRFLNYVLLNVRSVVFVELTCEIQVRAARYGHRVRSKSRRIRSPRDTDKSDLLLRQTLYKNIVPVVDAISFDTTTGNAKDYATEIVRSILKSVP